MAALRTTDEQFARILEQLQMDDPDVLLAVAEVDRSLIRLTLEQSPLDRVRSSGATASTLARLRRVAE